MIKKWTLLRAYLDKENNWARNYMTFFYNSIQF